MSITFQVKVAIVTAAGRGLGRAYARALAPRGARVASEACLRLSQPMDGNRVVFSMIEMAAN